VTVLVALESETGVHVGCDSYVGDGANRDVMAEKWFRRGPLLVASAGSVYAGQVAEFGVQFRAQRKTESDLEYVVIAVAEPIRVVHRATGTKLDGDSFVVAYNGRAYWIGDDYGVHRSLYGYVCAGAGEQFAAGSLATSAGRPPEARVRAALEAAAKHCTIVRSPFHVTFVATPPKRARR